MKKGKILLIAVLAIALVLTGCSAIANQIGNNIISGIQSELGASIDSKGGGITISTSSGTMQIGGTISWPKNWPSELPKLDGTITAATDVGLDKDGGIMVFLTASSVDAVKSYAEKYASMGYDKMLETASDGGYYVTYSNSKYYVTISVDDEKSAVIAVTANTTGTSSKE